VLVTLTIVTLILIHDHNMFMVQVSLWLVSFMLGVAIKSVMLSVVMLIAVESLRTPWRH